MSGIEVDEILGHAVVGKAQPRKRPADVDENDEPPTKRETLDLLAIAGADRDALLEALEATGEVEILDETGVKKLIGQLEKRVIQNQELRIKFADNPSKFMESEVELNVAIQEMHAIATMPQLYYLLTDLGAVPRLLELLMHQNTDIGIAVVNLFQELTEVETLQESEEDCKLLVDALLETNGLSLLVQNMERLDESVRDEADGVQKSLGVVENLLEFRPDVAKLCAEQGLLMFLLRRLRSKMPFDGNKLYASEILAILIQQDDTCRKTLGDLDGIDILLQQLAAYKRHNPSSEPEIEMMENLFNALCACLMHAPNRAKFLKGEGLQLMNLMLREKKMSRSSALRVLNYATMGKEGRDNCDKFVEILGLRTLFPLFMKTPEKARRKGYTAELHEEHVLSILSSLLKNCSTAQKTGTTSPKARVLNKFAETDYAKVERLVEIHFKYVERVHKFERRFMEENRSTEDLEEEDLYLQKLDAGLFTLQLVDYVIAVVYSATTSTTMQHRMSKMLSMRGTSMKQIEQILKSQLEFLGDDGGAERQALTSVLDKLRGKEHR